MSRPAHSVLTLSPLRGAWAGRTPRLSSGGGGGMRGTGDGSWGAFDVMLRDLKSVPKPTEF